MGSFKDLDLRIRADFPHYMHFILGSCTCGEEWSIIGYVPPFLELYCPECGKKKAVNAYTLRLNGKICRTCKECKPVSEFPALKYRKQNQCRACFNQYHREYQRNLRIQRQRPQDRQLPVYTLREQ